MAIISSPNMVGLRTSTAASRMISVRDRPSDGCASRRTQFSTMITELSTIRPKSIAPRLIRLAVMPVADIRLVANSIERGIASVTSSPARTLPSMTSRITITNTPPSVRLVSTVFSVRPMRAEPGRKPLPSLTPSGSVAWISLEAGFGPRGRPPRVFAVEHHHHADDGFAAAVAGDGPLPRQRARRKPWPRRGSRIGVPSAFSPHHDSLDVRHALQQGHAADKTLLAVVHDVAAAGRLVVPLDAAE